MNQVILSGYLGADPKIKYVQVNGESIQVADASLGVKDMQNTVWVDIQGWRKNAEKFTTLSKGSHINIIGKLVENKYTDKDGITHYNKRVIVAFVEYLDKKDNSNYQQNNTQVSQNTKENKSQNNTTNQNDDFSINDTDDDLPFN